MRNMFYFAKRFFLVLFFAFFHHAFVASGQGVQPSCSRTEFRIDHNKRFNIHVEISTSTQQNLLSCLTQCSKITDCDTVLFHRLSSSCIIGLFRHNTDQTVLKDYPDHVLGRKQAPPNQPGAYVTPGSATAGEEVTVRCNAFPSYPLITHMDVFLNDVLYTTTTQDTIDLVFNASASIGGWWKCVTYNALGQNFRIRLFTFVFLEATGKEFHVAFGPFLPTAPNPVSHHLVLQSAEYASINITSPRFPQKTIFLRPESSQQMPFTPADVQPANIGSSSVENMGITIRSNASIKVFAYSFSLNESSASLVYPIHDLTQRYIIGSYPTIGMYQNTTSKSYILVVASELNTEVSIFQKRSSNCNPQTVIYKGVGYGHGDYVNETLQNAGDVFYFVRHDCNINGWEVTASAPVAVFSGIEQVFTDSSASSTKGDPIYEQILPIDVIGYNAMGPKLFNKPALYNIIMPVPGSYVKYFENSSNIVHAFTFSATNFDDEFDAGPMNPHTLNFYTSSNSMSYMFMRPFESLAPSIGDPAMMTFLTKKHWPLSCHFGVPSFPFSDMEFRLFGAVPTKYAHAMLINGNPLPTSSSVNSYFNVFDEEVGPGYHVITSKAGTVRFFAGVYGTTRKSYPDNGFATLCSFSINLVV